MNKSNTDHIGFFERAIKSDGRYYTDAPHEDCDDLWCGDFNALQVGRYVDVLTGDHRELRALKSRTGQLWDVATGDLVVDAVGWRDVVGLKGWGE